MSARTVTSRPRRGRPPRGHPTLTRARVIDEALALVDEDGVDAISMRRLAKRLGVDPMSLYNHVDSKEAILDGIAEMLFGSLDLPAGGGDLRADLLAKSRAFRAAMLAHPRAAPLVLTRQLGSESSLEPIQSVLASLRAAGYPPELAVHHLRAVVAFMVGTLLRETEAAPTFSASSPEGARARRHQLEASGLPALIEAAPALSVCDHEAEFEFGLSLLLDSIVARR